MKSVHIAHKSYRVVLIHQIKNIIKSENQTTNIKSENHAKRIKHINDYDFTWFKITSIFRVLQVINVNNNIPEGQERKRQQGHERHYRH